MFIQRNWGEVLVFIQREVLVFIRGKVVGSVDVVRGLLANRRNRRY